MIFCWIMRVGFFLDKFFVRSGSNFELMIIGFDGFTVQVEIYDEWDKVLVKDVDRTVAGGCMVLKMLQLMVYQQNIS